MRTYRGDLVAIGAIVVGTLGSSVLFGRLTWHASEDMSVVVGPAALTVVSPGEAPALHREGAKVLRFISVEPAEGVYLTRPGNDDKLISAGTELTLEDGLFHGSFRTHGHLRQIQLRVEVLQGDKVTSSGSVSSLRPHIDVTRTGITFFGF